VPKGKGKLMEDITFNSKLHTNNYDEELNNSDDWNEEEMELAFKKSR
jgi:hypothetical protein